MIFLSRDDLCLMKYSAIHADLQPLGRVRNKGHIAERGGGASVNYFERRRTVTLYFCFVWGFLGLFGFFFVSSPAEL